MHIDPGDVAVLLEEVDSFAQGRVAAMTSRPEEPIPPEHLERLTAEVLALRILPDASDEDGLGLWEDCDHAHTMAFNIGVLRLLGQANAGVAFAWHRYALARAMERALGMDREEDGILGTTILPVGHYGLGRASLARWLIGRELAAEDSELLADWLDRHANTNILFAPESWRSVLWPVWTEGKVRWERRTRQRIDVLLSKAQHGLDEVSAYRIRTMDSVGNTASVVDAPSSVYARLLKLDMIGLTAIGVGAITKGLGMAREFAAIRKQGGKAIDRHPAVQALLGDAEIARNAGEVILGGYERPVDRIDLGRVVADRAGLFGRLCHAASQIVQAFGGVGYMRDLGAEKILRDMTMLRLQTGGMQDLHSFLAGWSGDWE